MSRLIITFVIFVAVVSTLITGHIFIKNFYADFSHSCDMAYINLMNSDFGSAKENIISLLRMMETNQTGLMIITEHSTIELISTKLHRAEILVELKEKSLAAADLTEARDIMKSVYLSQEPILENIL